MKTENKQVGKRGEDVAAEYLQNLGYRIEERNYSTRFGELDLVCWDGEILVFVEVKSKNGHDFGEPEEMVNKSKIAKVRRMGEMYVCERQWRGRVRVDVVAIVWNGGETERLTHYKNVYW